MFTRQTLTIKKTIDDRKMRFILVVSKKLEWPNMKRAIKAEEQVAVLKEGLEH